MQILMKFFVVNVFNGLTENDKGLIALSSCQPVYDLKTRYPERIEIQGN